VGELNQLVIDQEVGEREKAISSYRQATKRPTYLETFLGKTWCKIEKKRKRDREREREREEKNSSSQC